jgi:hypothetical protein
MEESMSKDFGRKADEFIARIQSLDLDRTTEVNLVYYGMTESGAGVSFIRSLMSITPRTTVRWPGHKGQAEAMAKSVHRQDIIGNINSLVRHTPEGFVLIHDAPEHVPLKIVDFELQISQ